MDAGSTPERIGEAHLAGSAAELQEAPWVCRIVFETSHCQNRRKPTRCQRTTVAGDDREGIQNAARSVPTTGGAMSLAGTRVEATPSCPLFTPILRQ
jgi:hypothetical protein